jgi:predicted metal-dependent hydrolase
LSATARREFAPRLKALAVLTDTSYAKMHVRAQRSCWGSRSCSGTISLNLCLLFLAPELMRYLLIHELCHGRHMNHSKRFWTLVGRFEPDYRRLDRALTESWREVPAWLGLY